jgi:anthranilate/para-aminobenzoate synthase component II
VVHVGEHVAVQDGQLTLRLLDGGGSDPNAVINALVVTKVDVPTGSLEVTLGPPAAVAAGAQWRVDGGAWQASGATVSGLEVGSHQVEYAPAKGWDGPAPEAVTISKDQTTSLVRTYTVSPVLARLDFGTASSPVAAGYERVTEATAYKASPGYGWLAGKVGSADVGIGSDLDRDLCYSPDKTFGVDVPAGTYDVTVSMGNKKWSHDQIAVILEGKQFEILTTPPNQVVTKVYRVAAFDCGAKVNILRNLVECGCDVTVLPADADAEEVLQRKPDGVFVSNGPGDPAAVTYTIDTLKRLIGKVPIFGICLGHQLLAWALGGRTFKLKFGHRGCNQPVRNESTGKVEITSQNHGFAADEQSLRATGAAVTHVNLNDGTVEGFTHADKALFSVQYHPEASPGPHDATYLFDCFRDMMETGRAPTAEQMHAAQEKLAKAGRKASPRR